MKAIIPAAGRGTRLVPASLMVPKTLVYVAGKPILGHILDNLNNIGIDNNIRIDSIGFITGDDGRKIIDYAKNNYDFSVDSVRQEDQLGLGHAIYRYLDENGFDENPILIILSDTIVDADLKTMIHSPNNAIAVKEVENPQRFGIVEVKGEFIQKLWEKPIHPPSNLAIVGVYFIKNVQLLFDCLKYIIDNDIRVNNEYQLTNALQEMLKYGVSITTFNVDAWLDCGTPESLLQANTHLLDRVNISYVIPGSIIHPHVMIDKSVRIENSIIGPYVSIANGVEIRNSIIKDTIINEEAKVSNSLIRESLIGYKAILNGQTGKLIIGDYSESTSILL